MLRLTISRNLIFSIKSSASAIQAVASQNCLATQLNRLPTIVNHRLLSITTPRLCDKAEENEAGGDEEKVHPLYKKFAGTDRDRSQPIPFEKSIEYLQSPAFKTTYGDHKVWQLYRRVHKGQFAPRKTRKTCVRGNVIAVGSPCPICRDEYLVLDYRNLELLKMFISPYTGQVSLF